MNTNRMCDKCTRQALWQLSPHRPTRGFFRRLACPRHVSTIMVAASLVDRGGTLQVTPVLDHPDWKNGERRNHSNTAAAR